MVEIDICHAHLIDGLVRSSKPERILECGFGGGRSHRAIAHAAKYNENMPHYTLVDSWHDWGGDMPPEVHAVIKEHQLNHITKDAKVNVFKSFTTHSMTEQQFIDCARKDTIKYDFIMMDADHQHSHEWAEQVCDELLTSPGILIYHDVDGSYPGLATLPGLLRHKPGYDTVVFNKSTREDEECKRGLLVVFKK